MSASAAFYALASRVENTRTPAELAFIACNETRLLTDYRQAALLTMDARNRPRLAAHSGLAEVDPNTPYALWLCEVARHVRPRLVEATSPLRVLALAPEMLSEETVREWSTWLPPHVWILTLAGPDGQIQALLLLGRGHPWPSTLSSADPEYALLQLGNLYGYAWWALHEHPSRWRRWWRMATSRRQLHRLAMALVLIAIIPVREYTLVPAEVVSTHSEVIAAPRDGVLRRMDVLPNMPVRAGQVLAELDDTTLRNRLEVARAELATASVEMHQSAQQAIESQGAKADLGVAEGKWRERQVEVAALQRELEKLAIKAPTDGVFVYSDPDEWAGRPVQTGERIGLLADPHALGVRAWAPASEPTNLEPGAPITLFLRVAPLHPIRARLDSAGYQAVEAPNGIASYVLRGTLENDHAEARIGLQGTARISGHWSVLGYLLLRRPLATLRSWVGL